MVFNLDTLNIHMNKWLLALKMIKPDVNMKKHYLIAVSTRKITTFFEGDQ